MRCSKREGGKRGSHDARQLAMGAAETSSDFVAEHGMKAGYVHNVERDPRVRMKLREGLKWHTGTAHLLSDDDPRERQRWLATQLPSSAGNTRAVRLFGTQILTVRIDLRDECEKNSGQS
jgi:hypothetical protein